MVHDECMADPGDGSPTWRQRRLGMELRRLREERNLGPHTAASLLGRTESSLSKLENAQRGIRKPALEQILDKYQVTDVTYRDALFTLARDAKKQDSLTSIRMGRKGGEHASANGSFTMMVAAGLWIVLVENVLEDPEDLRRYASVVEVAQAG